MHNYLKIIIFFLTYFISGSFNLEAQNLLIDDVVLENTGKNNSEYLSVFIKNKKNNTLDLNIIEQDIQQLIRRTGIAHASYEIDTINASSVRIKYIIQEQKTLIPQLGIGGIKNNFWWTAGLAEYNLFGKEQVLLGYFLQNDGRANFKTYYQNTRINGSNWGAAFDVNHQSSIEPLYFPTAAVSYIYSNSGAGILGIRHLGFNEKITVGGNYFEEKYEKEIIGENTPGPDFLKQKKILLKADYFLDKIQYNYFYRKGFYYNLKFQFVTTLGEKVPFNSLTFEGKQFWRSGKNGNIALRVRAAIASNNDSPFAPFVVDSRVNIRGVGNRVDRGTAQFVVNLEYRHTVFHKERWAGQLVGFSDWGTWRNPGGDFKQLLDRNQFRHFIGVGGRIINKKVLSLVLRLDYGFDVWNPNQNGFVFGINQYF